MEIQAVVSAAQALNEVVGSGKPESLPISERQQVAAIDLQGATSDSYASLLGKYSGQVQISRALGPDTNQIGLPSEVNQD